MPATPPYPPSWLDRFSQWVDRLPGPPWPYYLGIGAVGYLLTSMMRWVDGRQPLGTFNPAPPPFLLWVVGVLLLHSYLDRYARRALAQFEPLLHGGEGEMERLRYELTVTPARTARLGSLFWIVTSTVLVITSYERIKPFFPLWEVIISILSFAVGGSFMQHVIHQMRTVRRIYAQIKSVDLYNLEPLMAFSGLTVRAAIGMVLLQYAILALLPGEAKLTLLIPAGTLTLVAVVLFTWPLMGVHRLLLDEKSKQLGEVESRLKAMITLLYQRVDGAALAGVGEVEQAIGSLKTTREIIESRPTWPWQPATVRSLATAILLPIFLWLLQEVLQRLLRL